MINRSKILMEWLADLQSEVEAWLLSPISPEEHVALGKALDLLQDTEQVVVEHLIEEQQELSDD